MKISYRNHIFHGQTFLPPDRYEWILDEPFRLDQLSSTLKSREDIRIGQSQSWIKMLASVAQLILSCITIYRSRGSQLDRYGYAAFGLSVFPYAMMSFFNLIFIGILGEYPCLYIMRTAVLDEAKRCGASVSGEIGVLGETTADEKAGTSERKYVATWLQTELNEQGKILVVRLDDGRATTRRFKLFNYDDPADFVFGVDSVTNQENEVPYDVWTNDHDDLIVISWIVSFIIVFVIPYAFIFLLTRLHKRDRSLAERAWVMSWLVANQLIFVVLFVWGIVIPHFSWSRPTGTVVPIVLVPVSLMFIPAIGGFVTVGKMVFNFGSCS
jgi:hypothetical protein